MNKEESLKVLNKCLSEIESMSQEEFDRRDKQMSIKEYSDYVIDKIRSMTDEEFTVILDEAGINKCPLVRLNEIPNVEISLEEVAIEYSSEFWKKVNQSIKDEHIRFEKEEKLMQPTHEQMNKRFDI